MRHADVGEWAPWVSGRVARPPFEASTGRDEIGESTSSAAAVGERPTAARDLAEAPAVSRSVSTAVAEGHQREPPRGRRSKTAGSGRACYSVLRNCWLTARDG